jgi:hypothetical protein
LFFPLFVCKQIQILTKKLKAVEEELEEANELLDQYEQVWGTPFENQGQTNLFSVINVICDRFFYANI